MVLVRVDGVDTKGVRSQLRKVFEISPASFRVGERIVIVGIVSRALDGGRAGEALLVCDASNIAAVVISC